MTTRTAERTPIRLARTPLRGVSVRTQGETGDGSITLGGCAAVFDQETVLFDAWGWVMKEEIAPDAFDAVLGRVADGEELVHLTFNHDPDSAMASSAAYDGGGSVPVGGLKLTVEDHGLDYFARADGEDLDAQRVAVKLRSNVINQSSFMFTIEREELVEAYTEGGKDVEKWRILEIGHLYDVCVATQGAYSQTESWARTVFARSGFAPEPSGILTPRRGRGRHDSDESGTQNETVTSSRAASLALAATADKRTRELRDKGILA